jgi:hypothetical protein
MTSLSLHAGSVVKPLTIMTIDELEQLLSHAGCEGTEFEAESGAQAEVR